MAKHYCQVRAGLGPRLQRHKCQVRAGLGPRLLWVNASSLPFNAFSLPFNASSLPFNPCLSPFRATGLPLSVSSPPFNTSHCPLTPPFRPLTPLHWPVLLFCHSLTPLHHHLMTSRHLIILLCWCLFNKTLLELDYPVTITPKQWIVRAPICSIYVKIIFDLEIDLFDLEDHLKSSNYFQKMIFSGKITRKRGITLVSSFIC